MSHIASTSRVLTTLAATVIAMPLMAAEMITRESPHSVAETADRLAAAVEGAGAKVFARVDHAAGATSIGEELRPTTLLIFGNPKIGTPALQDAQTAGLDLPLRVLVYADADGQVKVLYRDPAQLAADHGLPADAGYLATMTGALGKLTGAATAE